MPGADIFDEVADVGREFLALSRSQQTLHNYLWQLGTICDLIKHTHSIVVQKLEAVEDADSPEQAKALLGELEGGPLTGSFRTNGLCDIFMGFGIALRRLVSTLGDTSRQNAWVKFCDALEDREREVASLYANQIQDITNLKYQLNTPQDLALVKTATREARQVLTKQMADFDALANQFRQK